MFKMEWIGRESQNVNNFPFSLFVNIIRMIGQNSYIFFLKTKHNVYPASFKVPEKIIFL
jgi:hypothetical protein